MQEIIENVTGVPLLLPLVSRATKSNMHIRDISLSLSRPRDASRRLKSTRSGRALLTLTDRNGEKQLYVSAGQRIKRKHADTNGNGHIIPADNMPIAKFAIRIHLWRDARTRRARARANPLARARVFVSAGRGGSSYEAALDMPMAVGGKNFSFFSPSPVPIPGEGGGRQGKGKRDRRVPCLSRFA